MQAVKARSDERGTILVEFIGSFLLFVLLIISILSLVNIVAVQARMHYALTQTANMLSMYGYTLHVIGLEDKLKNISTGALTVRNEANASIDEINEVLGSINNLDLAGVQKSAGTAAGRFESWADNTSGNPKQTLQLIAQYALGEIGSAAFEQVLRGLVIYYLANGEMSGEEYLSSFRINDDLQFHTLTLPSYIPAGAGKIVGSFTNIADNDSVLLDGEGNVKITLQYEVEYSFMGLRLPWGEQNPKLKITQSAMTKMWLGGSGDGYED